MKCDIEHFRRENCARCRDWDCRNATCTVNLLALSDGRCLTQRPPEPRRYAKPILVAPTKARRELN